MFIKTIAPIINEKALALGYNYPSAIIGQACLESSFGRSKLSQKYHNYFGLKCGSKWTGKAVNMATNEEFTVGSFTKVNSAFRVYDSQEKGVQGYFDFIGSKRYSNLKDATSPRHYLELITQDGYATDSKYVDKVYAIIEKYNLTQYDEPRQIALDFYIEEYARDVIAGKYGNGAERKQKLGDWYDPVQKRVNEILRGK